MSVVAHKVSLANATNRRQRLRLQPFLLADMGPDFQRRDYDIPAGARWWIAVSSPVKELEFEIGFDSIAVLISGRGVENVKLIDRATHESPQIAEGPRL